MPVNKQNREIKFERVREHLKDLAGKFIAEEGGIQSLITVTDLHLSEDQKYATIAVSVLPDEMTEQALAFLKRNRGDFREFVKKESRLRAIPTFDFILDLGEKNRQRVDELLGQYPNENKSA